MLLKYCNESWAYADLLYFKKVIRHHSPCFVSHRRATTIQWLMIPLLFEIHRSDFGICNAIWNINSNSVTNLDNSFPPNRISEFNRLYTHVNNWNRFIGVPNLTDYLPPWIGLTLTVPRMLCFSCRIFSVSNIAASALHSLLFTTYETYKFVKQRISNSYKMPMYYLNTRVLATTHRINANCMRCSR